jgi:hypothetical protein
VNHELYAYAYVKIVYFDKVVNVTRIISKNVYEALTDRLYDGLVVKSREEYSKSLI